MKTEVWCRFEVACCWFRVVGLLVSDFRHTQFVILVPGCGLLVAALGFKVFGLEGLCFEVRVGAFRFYAEL